MTELEGVRECSQQVGFSGLFAFGLGHYVSSHNFSTLMKTNLSLTPCTQESVRLDLMIVAQDY
jgi:hypothetical protein